MRITKADLDKNGYYAASDSLESDESIEIDADLGTVRLRGYLKTKLSIVAAAGSGIKAGWGIEAGWGIKAAWGIKAGKGIEAGEGIAAGKGIEAGWGIEAGLGIKAGKDISVKLRVFAGICMWRIPTTEEMTITAQRIEGNVAFGNLVLVPSADEAEDDEVRNNS